MTERKITHLTLKFTISSHLQHTKRVLKTELRFARIYSDSNVLASGSAQRAGVLCKVYSPLYFPLLSFLTPHYVALFQNTLSGSQNARNRVRVYSKSGIE